MVVNWDVGGIVNNHKSLKECKDERSERQQVAQIDELNLEYLHLSTQYSQGVSLLQNEKEKYIALEESGGSDYQLENQRYVLFDLESEVINGREGAQFPAASSS